MLICEHRYAKVTRYNEPAVIQNKITQIMLINTDHNIARH
jgi:hypothetical protein